MGINWKHRKVTVSIVMCVLLCVTAITAMMYTAFGAGSSNIKNVNATQVYSNDKAGSADTSEGRRRYAFKEISGGSICRSCYCSAIC